MKKIKINNVKILSLSLVVFLGLSSLVYAANYESKSSKLGKSYKENVKKENGKDKIVATVNGENIHASEVDFLKWQYENAADGMKPFAAEDNNNDSIIKNIAKEKLILAEAKTNKITLEAIESEQIQKNISDSFDKNTKENQDFIDNLGLTKEEVVKILVDLQSNTIIEARYINQKILPMVLENKLQTDDKNLINKVADYQQYNKDVKNQDGKTKAEKVKGLLDSYKDSLFVKAQFKALN